MLGINRSAASAVWTAALIVLLVQFVAAQGLSFFGSTDVHSVVSLAVVPLSAATDWPHKSKAVLTLAGFPFCATKDWPALK